MSTKVALLRALLVVLALLTFPSVRGAQSGNLEEAAQFNARMIRLYAAGRFGEAIPLAEKVLAFDETEFGPEHPDTAAGLNNLAQLYYATGAYAQAEPLFKRALAIREKVLGPEHLDTAQALNNLAVLYQATGAYAQAEPLYKRSLAIREKALGPEHPDTAQALNNLAVLYQTTGAYAQAEPLFKRALAIREKALGPEHPDTAESLNSLAVLYEDTGAYAQAEPLLKRALAIREKVLGSEHPDTAASLNNLASLYQDMGAYAQAEPLYERALAIDEKALGPEHPQTATILNNLADLYRETGAYALAELLYKQALAIDEKVLGLEHLYTARTLNNLVLLYCAIGAYARAEPLLKRALAIQEKALGPENPDTVTSLNNLAMLEWAQEQWSEAAGSLRRAADAGGSIAQSIFVLGDESRKRAFAATLTGTTNADVSFSLAARGHVPDAESLGLQVVLQRKGRVLDVMADSFAAVRRSLAPPDQQVFEQWRETNAQYATLLFRGPQKMPSEQYRALLGQLKGKAESLEGELSQRSAAFRRQVQTVTVERVQQAIPERAVLVEWLRYKPFNPKVYGNQPRWGAPRYLAYVLKRQGAPVAVDVGDAKAIETLISDLLVALRDPASSTVPELSRKLDGQLMQPLRPYIGDAERIVLSPDGQLNLLPFGVLTDRQGRYLIQSTEVTYVTSGRDLLRVASATPSRQAPVVIADPDFGPLDKAAAHEPADPTHRRSADMRGGVLQFKPLPGTAAEARAIQRILKLTDQQVLTRGNATATALKQLTGPRILHLATHGFFLADQAVDRKSTAPRPFGDDKAPVPTGENPLLRSGLALAGANQLHSGQDDGILTALEAAGLDLTGTELAVLSACETGVGQVQNGEGVYGLRRALVLAGVQTQVTSLWKVDDAATRDLMVDYYGQLSAGTGRSAALRAAQLAMLNDPERKHPYYWASFITIGAAGPLEP
ncbi:CHAT domain-containing protein [Burkholderia sp. R-69980]|nr:CHAT domain-containing protein [Burkholderia sp. R-69980]